MQVRASSTFGVLAALAAGCGSGGAKPDAQARDGTFAVCAGYDAGPYMAGYVTPSMLAAYTVTLVSVEADTMPPMPAPAVAYNTFLVSVRDASGAVPAGLVMTAEKPFMPKHNHSASVVPTVVDSRDGTFAVSRINFFMPGYWELTLNLLPAPDGGTATADKVVLSLCVAS